MGSDAYLSISNNHVAFPKQIITCILDPSSIKMQILLIVISLLKLKQFEICIIQIMHVQSLHDVFINHIYFLDLVSLSQMISDG